MSRRAFDRFMVDVEVGTNRKLRRLSPAERWCFVAGVLAIAAKSPERGRLLVGSDLPADENDYAEQAGVSVAVARATVAKLRDLRMLIDDDGSEVLHDFDAWQRKPRKPSEDSAATAERKRRSRATGDTNDTEGHADVTPPNGVTSRDVTRNREERREKTPQPPEGVTPSPAEIDAAADRLKTDADFTAWLAGHHTATGMTPPGDRTKALAAIRSSYAERRAEGWTAADLDLAVIGAVTDEYRRQHGYIDPTSVLRPTKIHALVERGRKAAASRRPGGDVAQANAVLDRQKAERAALLTANGGQA